MGCSASAIYPSGNFNINVPHPRNAFVGPNEELIKDATTTIQVYKHTRVFDYMSSKNVCAKMQEFSIVEISHAQLASKRSRVKPDRNVEIQRRDLLWDKKLHIFPNLDALKPFDKRAFEVTFCKLYFISCFTYSI